MKFRVTAVGYSDDVTQARRDVSLIVDVTSTVREVASGLVRAGAGRPKLLPYAVHRQAPFTLRVERPGMSPLILDAGDPIHAAGLMSGHVVEPVLEADPGEGSRTRSPVAQIIPLDGRQHGVAFLTVAGDTTIGRDRSNRVELHDPSVSRKHAVLRRTPDGVEIEDIGSVNGTWLLDEHGERVPNQGEVLRIRRTSVVEFGTLPVRIEIGPPTEPDSPRLGSIPRVQSPYVDPVYAPEAVELPAPPDEQKPGRFPLVAMVAPLLMGTVLYLTTKSMMSLIFVGLSPLIMIGSWLDQRLNRRKTLREQQREFRESLGQTEAALAENVPVEIAARNSETPSAAELAAVAPDFAPRLWVRRPEHRAFLEVRLGTATLPARKTVTLPPRGKIAAEHWAGLTAVHEKYRNVPGVPLLERLDRCGALGVAGPTFWAAQVTRAVLVQLLSSHSPANLVLTAFASERQAAGEWAWLKWLPHVDSAYSPIPVPHLVSDERMGNLLLTGLESVIAQRQEESKARAVRSRMDGSAHDAKERLTPADKLAMNPAIVVLVLTDSLVDMTRMVGIAEDGPDVGVHVIWQAPHLTLVPAACRTTVEVHERTWRAHLVRQGEVVELSAIEGIEQPLAEAFARSLSPVVDAGARVLDESDLPRSVALAGLLPGDVLGSAESIRHGWAATDSLMKAWQAGAERESGHLAAIVGQGSSGPMEIDLRAHGPHALVGGTTGSGKSEFLQSFITALAAKYSPDRLTFLLVDYKGGSAFSVCAELPHTVGLVTDLNTHLVRRALVSLRAELHYREELLAAKNAKDLVTLERRSDPDTPPALVIVIDEFAALVNEIPEFVDGMIDIAQRGRSLGLHLIMGTQRPAGVIKDNLRANTNLRISLRMADASDSSDVIGVTDAAFFSPETPGRAAVKVGAGRLTHFQSGYLGGRSDDTPREAVEVQDLKFGEPHPWPIAPEQQLQKRRSKGPVDIDVIATNITQAAQTEQIATPRKPWLDQLPSLLPLSSPLLSEKPPTDAGLTISLGLADEPHRQQQRPYRVAFGDVGNLAIFGGAGAGKTTTLISAVVAAVTQHPDAWVYGIDCGGGRLATLATLPNTGDVVSGEDTDRVVRMLGLVQSIVAERIVSSQAAPPVLLILDGLAAFRDAYEHRGGGVEALTTLTEIARAGRTVGVHVIMSCERSNALPTALGSAVPERLVLRLTSDADYQILGVAADVLTDAAPGRALRIGSENEIQVALPGAGADVDDTEAALRELAATITFDTDSRPDPVPTIPETILRTEITAPPGVPAPFAIDTVHLAAVPAPNDGLLLVTGPAGSGRTTAIRSLLEAFTEQAGGAPLDTVLISPRRSELRNHTGWTDVADTADTRDDTIRRLTLALGGTVKQSALAALPLIPLIGEPTPVTPSTPAPAASQSEVFPKPGRRGVVVIEDIGGFDGSGNEQALAALLKLLRRSDVTTIVEGENATLSTVWELVTPLRGARWALALQPDANDAPSLFTVAFTHAKRADYPPGRGFLVQGGHRVGVHIAMPANS